MRNTPFLLVLLFHFFFCPSFAGSIHSAIPEKEPMLIMIDRNFYPFEYIDENGRPAGFNVELLEAVMKKIKQPYAISFGNWNDILSSFEQGRTGLIPGIANLPHRTATMSFCIPHSEISLHVITWGNRSISSIEDLRNKSIIVQELDWAHEILSQTRVTDHIMAVGTVEEGMELLQTGDYDAFLCCDIVIQQRWKYRSDIRINRLDASAVPYSFAVHKDDDHLLYALNKALYELKVEGEYDILYNKWLGIYHPVQIPYSVWILILIFLIGGIVMIIFIFVLRKKVSNATASLRLSQHELQEKNNQLQLSLKIGKINPFVWDVTRDKVYVSMPIFEVGEFRDGPYERELTLEAFFPFFKEKDVDLAKKLFEEIRTGKVNHGYMEIQTRRRTPEFYYYDLYLMVQKKNKDGRPEIVIGYAQNITERKKTELDLAIAKEKAVRSDHFKSAFLANMSHEIRTPLNSIVGFSQLLKNAQTDEEKETYEHIISENSNILLKLINDVLDFSKIEAGYVELVNKSFYVNEFIEEMANAYRHRMPAGVRFEYNIPHYDCFIDFDKERLAQVIANLLSNAVKFTKVGSITFGYKLRKGGIIFYVCDTGIGISKQDQIKIFDRFEKVDSFAQGSGLGLPICKSIIESVGGYIRVESEPGRGCCFEVYLPCIPEVIPIENIHERSVKK